MDLPRHYLYRSLFWTFLSVAVYGSAAYLITLYLNILTTGGFEFADIHGAAMLGNLRGTAIALAAGAVALLAALAVALARQNQPLVERLYTLVMVYPLGGMAVGILIAAAVYVSVAHMGQVL
ncbi:MAG: hypothetical protein AAFX58_04310 [Pseudomonadota bacterium]